LSCLNYICLWLFVLCVRVCIVWTVFSSITLCALLFYVNMCAFHVYFTINLLTYFLCSLTRCLAPAPLKLRPYGAVLLLLLLWKHWLVGSLNAKALLPETNLCPLWYVFFVCDYSVYYEAIQWRQFSSTQKLIPTEPFENSDCTVDRSLCKESESVIWHVLTTDWHAQREAEKRTNFLLCVSLLNTWQKLLNFVTYIKEHISYNSVYLVWSCVKNFA